MVTMELMRLALVIEDGCGIRLDVVLDAQGGVDGAVNSSKVHRCKLLGSLNMKIIINADPS